MSCDRQIPQKSPYVMEMNPGTYHWCACGKSKGQPFCDGSHKGTPITPVAYEVKEKKKIAWCGCKHSKNGCLCDGSHKGL
jgi:CDGSH iron-sulfur domain-containing protein 3